jgi:hypothetical protein
MIRTIEDNFDYQADQIFKELADSYKDAQENRKKEGVNIQTFSDYLWENLDELGRAFFEKFDQYAGIEESTEKYNIR